MKTFFNVTDLETVLSFASLFSPVGTETVDVFEAVDRVVAQYIKAADNLPNFMRSIMDGYALQASSTFGASEANPAYLTIKGSVSMGSRPDFTLGQGEAARISTGGALPEGADGVAMIEHTEAVDEQTIEVYRSVAPGQHVVQVGEDFKIGDQLISSGQRLRAQEVGLMAGTGFESVEVFKKARVGIISSGDEIVPITENPKYGKIRDTNSYSLAGMVTAAGGIPVRYGIAEDSLKTLFDLCARAHEETDMLIISGGSSIGTRDYTVEALSQLPDSKILAHGITISPGKPTILAISDNKPVWGLPGHVVSAMVVFEAIVKPFLNCRNGLSFKEPHRWQISAKMTRNVASAQGRTDFIRVRLAEKEGEYWATPVLGKSGLIRTLVEADGLVAIDTNTEGLDIGTKVNVTLI
jgi:molybdopterin molybdotransferase